KKRKKKQLGCNLNGTNVCCFPFVRSSERCFVRMKPPPRARTKRDWSSRSAAPEARRETGCKWGRAELKKLLGALKALSQTTGGLEEVDYVVLKKRIPTRTVSE
ncbi:hypothetical protein XENORESO_018916, partial [Xenotaenia resolanae]